MNNGKTNFSPGENELNNPKQTTTVIHERNKAADNAARNKALAKIPLLNTTNIIIQKRKKPGAAKNKEIKNAIMISPAKAP